LAAEFTRLDDFNEANLLTNDTSLFQRLYVDLIDRQSLQIRQTNLCVPMLIQRFKTAFGQATLQRHLAAFKTDFMEAARPGFLSLVAATCGFAQTRADTTTDSTLGVLAAFCRLERIQLHARPLRLPTR